MALAEASEEHQKAASVSASRATTVFAAAEIRAACDGFSSKKLIGRGVRYPLEDTISKRVKSAYRRLCCLFVQPPVLCCEHNMITYIQHGILRGVTERSAARRCPAAACIAQEGVHRHTCWSAILAAAH